MTPPDPTLVGGVRDTLARLMGEAFLTEGRLGLAVSGGADSLALAILCAAAMPGRVEAASVDHGLSPLGADWARRAGEACTALGIPHTVLTLDWPDGAPAANRQARARDARYHRLGRWLAAQGLDALATGHQLDDQAETMIMRLDRGAGVGGLAGVRAKRLLMGLDGRSYFVIRPLLARRRAELAALVAAARLTPVDDPANIDPAHDRTRARALLEASPDYPDRTRLAASARYLGEADRALDWAAGQLRAAREHDVDGGFELDAEDLPRELQRRMALDIIRLMATGSGDEPRGDVLARALDRVRAGETVGLAHVVIRPKGARWRFEWAPPRR